MDDSILMTATREKYGLKSKDVSPIFPAKNIMQPLEQLIDEMYNNFVEETIEKCKKKKREEDFAYASCGNAEKEYFDGNVMDTLSAIRALQRSVAAKSSAFKRKQFDKLSVNAIPSFMKIHLKRFF